VQPHRVALSELGERQDDTSASLKPERMVVRVDGFGSELIDAVMRLGAELVDVHRLNCYRTTLRWL
jgi:hypothetical protein